MLPQRSQQEQLTSDTFKMLIFSVAVGWQEACNGICGGELTAAVFSWQRTILELIPQALLISVWRRMRCRVWWCLSFLMHSRQRLNHSSMVESPKLFSVCLCLCNDVSYQNDSLNQMSFTASTVYKNKILHLFAVTELSQRKSFQFQYLCVLKKKNCIYYKHFLCPLLNLHVHWYHKELQLQHACSIVYITVH